MPRLTPLPTSTSAVSVPHSRTPTNAQNAIPIVVPTPADPVTGRCSPGAGGERRDLARSQGAGSGPLHPRGDSVKGGPCVPLSGHETLRRDGGSARGAGLRAGGEATAPFALLLGVERGEIDIGIGRAAGD